jgi:hypothetical protein
MGYLFTLSPARSLRPIPCHVEEDGAVMITGDGFCPNEAVERVLSKFLRRCHLGRPRA